MRLVSSAFEEGGFIPKQYTCDGANISPPLRWLEIPSGVGSFVLVIDDPDAPGGSWVHWSLYNLPADIHELPEELRPSDPELREAAIGPNSWERREYAGPCPPGVEPHHYVFTLYALDRRLTAASYADIEAMAADMEPYILEKNNINGFI